MNSLGNAQSNISAHYDISNAMFAGQFLNLSSRFYYRG